MSDIKLNRPSPITIISWFWIFWGILLSISAGLGIIGYFSTQEIPIHQFNSAESSSRVSIFSFMFDHFILIAVLQILLSAASITAGVYLLRIRSWARTVLEFLSWLFLLMLSLFWIIWSFDRLMMIRDSNIQKFNIAGMMLNIIFLVAYSIPLITMIRYLRKKEVRSVFVVELDKRK